MSQPEKLSLVLYEEHHRPRYFELSRTTVRVLMYGLPFITLISLAGLLGVAYYLKENHAQAMRKEPQVILSLREENQRLMEEKEELVQTTKNLETKLATTDIDTEGLSATLGLFKYTPGMEDLSANPVLAIEDISIAEEQQGLFLQFNLVNLTQDTSRQAGYIFILLISGRTITFYPETAFTEDDPLISFNKGEYFAAARFRPVEARFPITSQEKRGLIKIILFSRTGDLLAKKTQNYSF